MIRLNTELTIKIAEWLELEFDLKRTKKDEMELRKELVGEILSEFKDGRVIALSSAEVNSDPVIYEIKAKQPIKIRFDMKAYQNFDDLTEEEKELVEYKPVVSAAKLKAYIAENPMSRIARITEEHDEGAPTLSILEYEG